MKTKTKEAPRTATYVYCVVKSGRASKTLGRSPKGLARAEAPRVVDAGGGYQIVVATAPLSEYSADAIDPRLRDIDWVSERAAEHEAVVEHAAKLGTVVPMKLFTLFATDERAVAHVAKMKKSLDRIVTRIAGCDEWGLRVLFDEAGALKAAVSTKRPADSGTGFLRQKKNVQDVRRTLSGRAADEVDALYTRLAKRSKRAVRRPPAARELEGRVLLDAVFLVPQGGTKQFTSTVAASAKDLVQEGFHVRLTGPWPAYSFIGAR